MCIWNNACICVCQWVICANRIDAHYQNLRRIVNFHSQYGTLGRQINFKLNTDMANFPVSTMPADGLAPLSARASTGRVITKVEHVWNQLWGVNMMFIHSIHTSQFKEEKTAGVWGNAGYYTISCVIMEIVAHYLVGCTGFICTELDNNRGKVLLRIYMVSVYTQCDYSWRCLRRINGPSIKSLCIRCTWIAGLYVYHLHCVV